MSLKGSIQQISKSLLKWPFSKSLAKKYQKKGKRRKKLFFTMKITTVTITFDERS